MSNDSYNQSRGAKLAEGVLNWAIDTIARAGAVFVESITSDARKAIEKNVVSRLEVTEHNVAQWRRTKLSDNDDLPESLRGDGVVSGGAASASSGSETSSTGCGPTTATAQDNGART